MVCHVSGEDPNSGSNYDVYLAKGLLYPGIYWYPQALLQTRTDSVEWMALYSVVQASVGDFY